MPRMLVVFRPVLSEVSSTSTASRSRTAAVMVMYGRVSSAAQVMIEMLAGASVSVCSTPAAVTTMPSGVVASVGLPGAAAWAMTGNPEQATGSARERRARRVSGLARETGMGSYGSGAAIGMAFQGTQPVAVRHPFRGRWRVWVRSGRRWRLLHRVSVCAV